MTYYLHFNSNLWKVWLKNKEVVNFTKWKTNIKRKDLTYYETKKHNEFIKETGWKWAK